MSHLSYDHFFSVLGNKQRTKIIQLLNEEGEMNVTSIAQKLGVEQSAISHCLKQLLHCHFVSVEQVGKERIYSINIDTMRPLLQQIERHIKKYCAEECKHWD